MRCAITWIGERLVHFGVVRDEVFKVHELTLEPQAGIRTCHAPCCHGVGPERRFRSNRKEYHDRERLPENDRFRAVSGALFKN